MSLPFIFPKPRDWNTLEDIVCDVMQRKRNSLNLQRYGRNGQLQNGVDVAGLLKVGIMGIQCKHHPDHNIAVDEIDDEITKSEKFKPKLSELWIATSANRDVNITSYVLEISHQRQSRREYPVIIKFWEDIFEWLSEYPDLVYKHFTSYFPIQELEELRYPIEGFAPKASLQWPILPEELKAAIFQSFEGIELTTLYQVTLGVTTFPQTNFSSLVDLQLSLDNLFENELQAAENFVQVNKILRDIRDILSDQSFYSRDLWVYPNVRLSVAFLIGWQFRRVANFRLRLIANNQVWATEELPYVSPELSDDLPVMLNDKSSEVVVVLNISRNIEDTVRAYIDTWNSSPKAILVWNLNSHTVRNAAHALSLAMTISQKVKALIDSNHITHVHLFAALPASLATLVAYHLNAICPISFYFRDSTRSNYSLGGTLDNTF
jgi:hypothetical protein